MFLSPNVKSKGTSNLYVFHLAMLNILHELRLLIIKLKGTKQKRNYLGALLPIILQSLFCLKFKTQLVLDKELEKPRK